MMTNARLGACAVVLCGGVLAATLEGQQQVPTFRSATRTVPVYATVTDASGRLVPDLERGDFEIWDNGQKVEISLFENAIQPITVVVRRRTLMTRPRGPTVRLSSSAHSKSC
jgi:hypothetical protein